MRKHNVAVEPFPVMVMLSGVSKIGSAKKKERAVLAVEHVVLSIQESGPTNENCPSISLVRTARMASMEYGLLIGQSDVQIRDMPIHFKISKTSEFQKTLEF